MTSTRRLRALLLAVALAGPALPAFAQDVDAGDVAFWQSIKDSDNPAEYQAYLQAFPNGLFAELANVRLAGLGAGNGDTLKGPTPAPGPVPGAPLSDAVLSLTPAQPRVGDTISLSTSNMPTPSTNDALIVVAAGTPDSLVEIFKPGIIKWDYATYNANGQKDWEIGQLPPGAYEVRWVTQLYNTEGRLEIGARQSFQVSR